jgi:hypothetical protein
MNTIPEPAELVPDPQCRKELGNMSEMTWWRMEHGQGDTPPMPNFPERFRIRNRNYRMRSQFEHFKHSLKVEA